MQSSGTSRAGHTTWQHILLGISVLAFGVVVASLHGWARDVLLFVAVVVAAGAWARERWYARRRLRALALEIQRGKVEVARDPAEAMLQQAINRALGQQCAAATGQRSRLLVVVALQPPITYTATRRAGLDHMLRSHAAMHRAVLQVEGNGLFLLIFPVTEGASLRHIYSVALGVVASMQHTAADLHLGLACGLGEQHPQPHGAHFVAPALEDAARLARMALAWQHPLLCTEPVARLLPGQAVARTPLELTHPQLPPLRVWTLTPVPETVALAGC